MNRRWFILPLLPVLLVGCSSENSFIEEQIRQKSGVQDDANYKQYLSYEEQGKLSEDGYYLEDSAETDVIPSNTVHITFADNAFLDVQFYIDAEHTSIIEPTGSYLPVGSSVFAVASPSDKAPSSEYVFSGFRIYQYDIDGNRKLLNDELIIPGDDGLIISVTDDLIGKELSIEPVGNYQTREVFLSAYCVDDDDQETEISVSWYINDEHVAGDKAEINPVSSYIVSCEYDSDEYFYLSSEPECFYSSNEDGIVIFNKREANESTEGYTVKLHQYLTVPLKTTAKRKVKIGSEDSKLETIEANEDLPIPHLKYGEQITVYTDSEWPELNNNREVIVQSEGFTQEKTLSYEYVLAIPQKGGEFVFEPSEYSYEHGTITFTCFGDEVTSTQYLASGSKIYYEQNTVEDGYQLGGTERVIKVTTPEKTREQLNKISFVQKSYSTVRLGQPACGGAISYSCNGKELDSDEYQADSGDTIKMFFQPWEGWISNYQDGKEYTVTTAKEQTVGVSVAAFVEDEAHKPKLTVILDKSIGNMKVSLAASGLGKDSYGYEEEGLFQSGCTIVDEQSIGTEQGISISLSGRAIQAGTAVKILVEKKGEDKFVNSGKSTTTTECYLIDDLTNVLDPIDIYSREEMGSSTVWYESVKITISVVDVMELTSSITASHATVAIRNQETSEIIHAGDMMEGDKKVTVTITPDNGYYITGKDVKNNLYQKTMSFKNCLSDIDKIVQEHPIEKYCEIELESKDSYGTCSYTLDGKSVTGKVSAKVGQKLEIKYQITDESYVIEGAAGLFGSPLGKNDKEKVESITIDRSCDGTKIDRAAFGIKVTKGA